MSEEEEEVMVIIREIEDKIDITIFYWETMNMITSYYYPTKKGFVDNPPEFFKSSRKPKVALICDISNYAFRKAVKNIFDEISVPYFFTSEIISYLNGLIVASNNDFKNNECIIAVIIFKTTFLVIGLQYFETTGFKAIYDHLIGKFKKLNLEELPKILSEDGRKVVVGYFEGEGTKNRADKFQGADNIEIIAFGSSRIYQRTIKEICKWILDESYKKFHIIPFLCFDTQIFLVCNNKTYEIFKLRHNCNTTLPLKQKFCGKKSNFQYFIGYQGEQIGGEAFSSLPHLFNYDIILNIDKDHFVSFEIDKSVSSMNVGCSALTDIHALLPYIFNNEMESKKPVIVLNNNSSFIFTFKDKVGYNGMKAWNRRCGNFLYISFDKEVEEYGDDAKKVLKTHPENVVYDLIFLMSQPPEKFFVKDCYKFKIKKNDEHSVNLEFRVHDGTWNAATPSFLFAMFIKKMRLAIKEEMKSKSRPTELCFCLIDVENEELIKKGIEETCTLLNQYIRKEEKRIQCNFLNLK